MPNDILCDDTGDLAFENGDFVVGESTNQQIQDILMAAPGHYRQYPTIGGNIMTMLNGDWSQETARGIQMALEADGLNINGVSFKDGVLNIDRE